jgi:Spy/CpxP family protein refolding chaperone
MLLAMALATLLPLASAEAQPRSKDTGKAKPQAQREERAEFDDWCCGMGPCGGAGLGHREGLGPGMGPGMGMGPGFGRGHGGPGWHARRGGPGGPGAGWGGRSRGLMRGDGPLADRLKLSTEQRRKLRDLGPTHRREMVRLRADLETAQIDLQEAMRDDAPGARSVDQRIDALAALHAKQMKAMAAHWSEVRSILTPEQRAKLRDLRPGRGGRFGSDDDEEDED